MCKEKIYKSRRVVISLVGFTWFLKKNKAECTWLTFLHAINILLAKLNEKPTEEKEKKRLHNRFMIN